MKKWIIAVAAVAAVAAIGTGAVMAQTPGADAGTTFMDRVAQKLGIDTPKLQDAVKGARSDEIDDAVKNGDLTQQQADNLKQRLDAMPDSGGFGLHGGPKGFRGGPGGMAPGIPGIGLPEAADKLAEFLGITADQLMTELQADNATLATVAEAHGKSRDALKTFISEGVKAKLDEAVKNQDLTQKRAGETLAQLDSHLDQMIDAKCGGFGKHRFGGPGMHPGMHADDLPDDQGDISPSMFRS
ncbi:MAG: hypothetical protein HY874_04720 [Chloroflexi bacterium]|nr:hypothetical protein [Chloroflexota bacterium]